MFHRFCSGTATTRGQLSWPLCIGVGPSIEGEKSRSPTQTPRQSSCLRLMDFSCEPGALSPAMMIDLLSWRSPTQPPRQSSCLRFMDFSCEDLPGALSPAMMIDLLSWCSPTQPPRQSSCLRFMDFSCENLPGTLSPAMMIDLLSWCARVHVWFTWE